MMGEKLTMTAQEVASLLGCHKDTIYDMARKGEIPHFRFGPGRKRVYFRRDSIEQWMAERERGSGKQWR